MTNLEAKQALARKLNIDYADIANNDLFADADLQDYIQAAAQRAWDYKPWDFAEGAKTGTLTSGNISAGYVDYPQDFQTGSVTLLVVNGAEFPLKNKLLYADYRKFLEDNRTSTEKVWCEYKRFLFVNMNACAAGQSFDVYGKLRCPTLSADADLLPFSPDSDNQEDSGNKAIVDLAYAEALGSEKKKMYDQATGARKEAYAALEIVWRPMGELRANQQSKNRPAFDVPDYFNRATTRQTPIGNFNL